MQLSALITLAMITTATAQTRLYRRVSGEHVREIATFNKNDWYTSGEGENAICSSHSKDEPNKLKGFSLTSDPHTPAIGKNKKLWLRKTSDIEVDTSGGGLRAVHDGIPFPEHWTITVTHPVKCKDLMVQINKIPWVDPAVTQKSLPKLKTTKRSEHAMNRVRMVNEAVEFEKRQLSVEELD